MSDAFDNWLQERPPEAEVDDGRLLPGTVIGAYRIESFLGKGGFAEVYRAKGSDGGHVAIKILHRLDEQSRLRFEREANILSQIHHPNMPRLLSFGSCGDRPYLVTELLQTRELPHKDKAVASFIKAVCAAANALHEKGYVHRDIKPSNVLWRGDTPVLIDFGLACLKSETPRSPSTISIVDGQRIVVGTAGYAAPEQFAGGKIDETTDVHAIGMLADACFGGKPPKCWRRIIDRATNSRNSGRYATAKKLARRVLLRDVCVIFVSLALGIGLFCCYLFLNNSISDSNVERIRCLALDELEKRVFVKSFTGTGFDYDFWSLHDDLLQFRLPICGYEVSLTIDKTMQSIVENALENGCKLCGHASGAAAVVDAKTGYVLAMTSFGGHGTNLALRAFVPGATMMPFCACSAIQNDVAMSCTDVRTDRDRSLPGDGNARWPSTMSMFDAMCKSSNIVFGRIGRDIGGSGLFESYRNFGFGQGTGLGLDCSKRGILSIGDGSRLAVGQYVWVTLLQMVRAYAVFGNGGKLIDLHLLKSINDDGGREIWRAVQVIAGQPISYGLSLKMLGSLKLCGEDSGLTKSGDLIEMCGKTGTFVLTWRANGEKEYGSNYLGLCSRGGRRYVIGVVLWGLTAPKYRSVETSMPIFSSIAVGIENSECTTIEDMPGIILNVDGQ